VGALVDACNLKESEHEGGNKLQDQQCSRSFQRLDAPSLQETLRHSATEQLHRLLQQKSKAKVRLEAGIHYLCECRITSKRN